LINISLRWSILEKLYIRDAIYDEIPVYRVIEEPIINRWEFQRLRYIKQLQLTYLVYPSATHTRFEHSLGVMHLAGLFTDFLFGENTNIEKIKRIAGLEIVNDDAFIKMNRHIVRLAGLLHDIGHGPLGHVFDEIVLPSIAGDYKLLRTKCFSHELIGFLIYWYRLRDNIERTLTKLAPGIDRFVEDMITWLDQIMVPLCMDERERLIYNRLFNIPEKGYGYFLRMIVRDYLYPADLLDYLVRDSVYTGAVELGLINRNRLMRNTVPVPRDQMIEGLEEFESRSVIDRISHIRTPVILGITDKIIPDILRFLHARRLMYENVYLHSVIKVFGWSAVKVLTHEKVWETTGITKDMILGIVDNPVDQGRVEEFLEKYLDLTDYILLHAWRMYRNKELMDSSVVQNLESLFKYRKPLYQMIARDIVFSNPVFTINSGVGEEIDKYRESIKNLVIRNSTQIGVDMKIDIEKIQIFPGSAWMIQGAYFYIVENGTHTVRDIGEFANRYGLMNIGEIRLYVKRDLGGDVKERLKKAFLANVKNNTGLREDLKRVIGLTTASSITM
jgi:HD superfamily phosphohydrolase